MASTLTSRPVMAISIRQNGPNGTEKRLEGVRAFNQTSDGLRVTMLGPDRDETVQETFEHAKVVGGSATLEEQ